VKQAGKRHRDLAFGGAQTRLAALQAGEVEMVLEKSGIQWASLSRNGGCWLSRADECGLMCRGGE